MLQKEKVIRLKPQAKIPKQQGLRRFVFAVIISIITIFIFATLSQNTESDEEYLAELEAKVKNGYALSSGEKKDLCRLLYTLRNSISAECVCILDGLNWDNPPKKPELLPEFWEEIINPKNVSSHREFRHKLYPKIEIGYDALDKIQRNKPHWHRINPNKKNKNDYYLDKDCNPVPKSSPSSHIRPR